MAATSDASFVVINNIPKSYRSADLRNFFSHFVESNGFLCFHFRHRPEIQKKACSKEEPEPENAPSKCQTACCVVKVDATRTDQFLKSYNGKHWTDKKGEDLLTRCFITKIKVSESEEETPKTGFNVLKKGTVSSSLPADKESFSKKDLNSLIEMHPPTIMQKGNVGTPTIHFLEQIRACRMPPSLIAKLGLQFPRSRARRMYGSVPPFHKIHIKGKHKKAASSEEKAPSSSFTKTYLKRDYTPHHQLSDDNEEEEDDDESEEEEWDRHEALHDDVTCQERNKERLFENEIELKWEKGGSGLVFYTDAQFWDNKDGDFDGKTADDWDVDTSIYHEPAVTADKDARDMFQMRLEEHLRDEDSDQLHTFASFEKYSKGIGRKVLEAQGWKQGEGVGRNARGIAEPINSDGQLPFDKKGFGYRGEKLQRRPAKPFRRKRRHPTDDGERIHISTIYDPPQEKMSSKSLLTSSFFSRLKYRTRFLKEDGSD